MTSNQPPRIPAWLLRHFGSSRSNAAIIGDLHEGYQQGRSAAWYWNQVLTAIITGTCKDTDTLKSLVAGWLVFLTLFTVLFPFFGRCTVLVSITGSISGFMVGCLSSHARWRGILLFSTMVSAYWVCIGSTSSPYTPVLRTYKMLAMALSSRSAQVSTHILIGNLIVLIFFIWLGAIFSSCLDTPHSNERKHEINGTA